MGIFMEMPKALRLVPFCTNKLHFTLFFRPLIFNIFFALLPLLLFYLNSHTIYVYELSACHTRIHVLSHRKMDLITLDVNEEKGVSGVNYIVYTLFICVHRRNFIFLFVFIER